MTTCHSGKMTPGFLAVVLILVLMPWVNVSAQERMQPIPADKMTEAQKKAVAEYVAARGTALSDRGESIGCSCSVTTPMTLAFTESQTARHSRVPIIRFGWVNDFRGFTGSLFAAACRVACPPGGSDRLDVRPTGTFTPELSTGWSPFTSSGITTVATEQVPPTGLSPVGTAASIAALTLSFTTSRRFNRRTEADMSASGHAKPRGGIGVSSHWGWDRNHHPSARVYARA